MRVLDASFGHLVLLMPEEQKNIDVIEEIEKLKEVGQVVVCISGYDRVEEVICKLIKSSTWNM